MPGEKHKRRHSEKSPEGPPKDGKSVKKHKKQKSATENKHKRKHEGDGLNEVQESAVQRDSVAANVVSAEKNEKEKKRGDADAEINRMEHVTEPTKSEEKRKKKKKKKERKPDDLNEQASEEKHVKSNSESAETIKNHDQEDTAGPAENPNEAGSPKAAKKRKKKKKDRKASNTSGEGDDDKQANAGEDAGNAKKHTDSENVVKSHDRPDGEPGADENMLEKDLIDGADNSTSKEMEISLDNPSKKQSKKRKREAQRLEASNQHPVKDSNVDRLEAKQEQSPKKRVKRVESEASSPVKAENANEISANKTQPSNPTKQQPKSDTPSGDPSKEASEKLSGDQEGDDTPLDDKRLPRTLFVGNVPHTANRKEIRKMFSKYGAIDSIRIRNVIPDNPKIPKKAALLANRLAKFSNSFSAYIVFKEADNVDQVLQNAVNGTNMAIFKDHHLRVTKALQTKGRRRLSVFIGNLPFDCTDEELITTFMPIAKECGVNLLNVRVSRDSDTGVGRGVGFASFDDMMGIQACMNKAGEIKLRGRVLRIERAFKTKMMKSKSYKKKRQATFGRKGRKTRT